MNNVNHPWTQQRPLTKKQIEYRSMSKEQRKKYDDYERAKDHEKVRGKFIFHEVPGGTLQFTYVKYKCDYNEDHNFALRDGEIYELPYMVAKHLNTACSYPVYEYFKDEGTQDVMRIKENIRRTSFQSLDFMEDEESIPKSIFEVEKVVEEKKVKNA